MKCYRFPDRDTFVASCDTLGWLSEPSEGAPEASVIAYTSTRAIDEIGCLETTPGTYDEEGNELTPPVMDMCHHVNYVGDDVEAWEQYRVYPNSPSRCFAGGSVEPEDIPTEV